MEGTAGGRFRSPRGHEDKGFPQATPDPSASDGDARLGAGCGDLPDSGLGAVGRDTRAFRGGDAGHAAGHVPDSGLSRGALRGAGQQRDVSAQRPFLVPVLRIYRQHPLCAGPAQAVHPLACSGGCGLRPGTGGLCGRRPLRLRPSRGGLVIDGPEPSGRLSAADVLVRGRAADVPRLPAVEGARGVLDLLGGCHPPALGSPYRRRGPYVAQRPVRGGLRHLYLPSAGLYRSVRPSLRPCLRAGLQVPGRHILSGLHDPLSLHVPVLFLDLYRRAFLRGVAVGGDGVPGQHSPGVHRSEGV